jgi:hypothetical protein
MARPSEEWQNRVRGLLRAELARRDVSHRELVERLAAIGVRESESNISNKLARGTFTAAFLVQCMEAIGCRTIHLDRDD